MAPLLLFAMSEKEERPTPQSESEADNRKYRHNNRAQIDPRLVLGGGVLLILAGPLLVVAVDIQSALASTPAFTGVSAAIIAILLVTAIAAAALGLD